MRGVLTLWLMAAHPNESDLVNTVCMSRPNWSPTPYLVSPLSLCLAWPKPRSTCLARLNITLLGFELIHTEVPCFLGQPTI